jgi:hypothetical protein
VHLCNAKSFATRHLYLQRNGTGWHSFVFILLTVIYRCLNGNDDAVVLYFCSSFGIQMLYRMNGT